MRYVLAATIGLMLLKGNVVAAELPTYEISGFPVTPHQAAIIGSDGIHERSPTPTLTVNGMSASPHQIQVLMLRAKSMWQHAEMPNRGE